MNQGNLANDGDALATPSRALTPLRAALLMVGAVLGGVALSLILGSSPAHAAENPGPDSGPLAPVSATVTSAVHSAIPGTQHLVTVGGGSLVSAIPATDPAVAPVVSAVGATLTTVDQVVTPVVDRVLTLAPLRASIAGGALAPMISAPFFIGSPSASAVGSVLAAAAGSGELLPSPVLTSSPSAPVAGLCILLATLLALALLGARKRLLDDALPASPVFETDTSPA